MTHAIRLFILALWLCALILSGCARLSIRVDMLNSAYWASPEYIDSVTLAKIADAEQAIRDGRFVAQREALKGDLRQTLVTMSKEQPRGISPQDVNEIAGNFETKINKEFEKARGCFRAAFDKVREATLSPSQRDREKNISEGKALFSEGAGALALLVDSLSKDIRKRVNLREDESAPTALKTFEEKSKDRVGLIGDAGILGDPRASAVVYAPDEYWKGQLNETFCRGWFGNTDCAVKMEGLGGFTLKGVRLDATKITQATFSVAREAIQTVAAVYGVPIPKGQPATTGASGKESSAAATVEIDSPVKRQQDAETKILQLRIARLAMFETIITQLPAIRGNDTARTQAIKAIKGGLESNRKQLDPSPTQ
jgi:hypothetical protein